MILRSLWFQLNGNVGISGERDCVNETICISLELNKMMQRSRVYISEGYKIECNDQWINGIFEAFAAHHDSICGGIPKNHSYLNSRDHVLEV